MASNVIQKIGKYDVTDKLGEGGMGVVYKGIDPGIGRPVAIKMMTGGFAENPDLLKRFQREAQSAGTLQHPNIVIIYELGTHEGNPYMAMEFIAGESLEALVTSHRRMSLVEKTEIMIQILNGLQYAHEHGIVHRDIKPGNIMLLKDGTVKIVDFGIARISDNSMTKTGQIVGTINYMSPEQFNGHIVDGRSDIWSSGVLFYEFLTGALPFDGNETPTVILKILNEVPPPLKNHLQNFPPELEECLTKALTKDREERYASAEDFAFDLARIQESLKKDMVLEYVEQAKQAFSKSELTKAKDLLQQVLKVDTKHVTAKELMKEVQTALSVQQRGEQVRQLRASAEEALGNKMLDEAVSFADQALKLDKNNPELLQLQKLVMQAKARKDQLEKTLLKAQHLREDGDLDAALRTVDDALALDPKDTNAKNTREAIAAEIKKLQSQKETTALLDEARKEVSARHFTAALELIRKAESLTPGVTQSGSLRNMVAASREQEMRRIAVDRLAVDIELALHRESKQVVQQKTDEALKKYPDETILADIAKTAPEIRQAAGLGEVAKVSGHAQQLIADQNFEPAIALLEHAIKAAPDEGLKSLLSNARNGWEELSKKSSACAAEAQQLLKSSKVDEAVALMESQPVSYLRSTPFYEAMLKARAEQDRLGTIENSVLEARKLMLKGDVTGAWTKAKDILQANPTSAPAQGFLKEVESQRAVQAKDAVEKAIKDAKALLLARQGSAASLKLQTVISLVPAAPPPVQKAFEALQREIKAGTSQQHINADMNKTIVQGSAGASTGAGAAAAPAPAVQRTMVQPMVAPAKPFPMKQVISAVLAVALVVGGFVGYKVLTAPLPLDSYVEINATPWAKITNIVSKDGKHTYQVNQETPVRVALPSGDYTVNATDADGKPMTQGIQVSKTAPGSVTLGQAIDRKGADEIVQSSN
jgi:serine/threonine-protein kinase